MITIAGRFASSEFGPGAALVATTLAIAPIAPTAIISEVSTATAVCRWPADVSADSFSVEVRLAGSLNGAQVYSGTELTTTLTALARATPYEVRASATNSAGISNGRWIRFDTLPDVPAAPTIINIDATDNQIAITWRLNDDGGALIQSTRVILTNLVTNQPLEQLVYSTLAVFRVLPSAQSFRVELLTRNWVGFGPSTVTATSTLPQSPTITAFVASDPDNGDVIYGANDILTFTFSTATNQPTVATTNDIDTLFQFSQSIGIDYHGVWISNTLLIITITSPSLVPPSIGLTVTVLSGGNLRTQSLQSLPSTASASLTGNWGTAVGTNSITVPTTALQLLEDAAPVLIQGIVANLVDTTGFTLSIISLHGRVALAPSSTFASQIDRTGLTSQDVRNILATILFSPEPNYNGLASITIRLGRTTAQDEKSISIQITPVNDPPTFALPSQITLQADVWTPLGTAASLSSDNSIVRLSLSSQQVLFIVPTIDASLVSSLTFSRPFETSTELISIEGSPSEVQYVLQNYLEVKFPVANGVTGTISGYLTDGSTPQAITLFALIRVNLDCTSVPMPSATMAVLSSDFSSITVVMDSPVRPSTLTNVLCTSIISTTTLGTGANCKWVSLTSLLIQLGMGTTIQPGDLLSFQPNFVPYCSSTIYVTTNPVMVTAPLNPTPLVINLQAPATADLCADYIAIASASPLGGRAASYTWSADQTVLAASSVSTASTGNRLQIPSYSLLPGQTYYVTVTVVSGPRRASASFSFRKQSAPSPIVTINGGQALSVRFSSAFVLEAQMALSLCLASVQNVAYSWDCTPPPTIALDPLSRDSSRLRVAARSLQPGTVYEFGVSATARLSDGSTSPAGRSVIQVVVELSDLYPSIKGGSSRSVAVLQNQIILDGSDSLDPDSTVDPLQYQWSCSCSLGSCLNTNGDEITFTSSAIQTLSISSFVEGVYTFTLTISKPGRSKSVKQVITITGNDPQVSLQTRSAVLRITDALSVSGDVIIYGGTLVSHQWFVRQEGFNDLMPISGTSWSGNSGAVFITNFGLTHPGGNYVIVLTVTDNNGRSGTAEAQVTVASSPHSGVLISEPASGEALETLFALTADDWLPASLSYQWFVTSQSKRVPLGSPSRATTLSTLLPIANTFGCEISDPIGGGVTTAIGAITVSAPTVDLRQLLTDGLQRAEQLGTSSELSSILAIASVVMNSGIQNSIELRADLGTTLNAIVSQSDPSTAVRQLESIVNDPTQVPTGTVPVNLDTVSKALILLDTSGTTTHDTLQTILRILASSIQTLVAPPRPGRRLLSVGTDLATVRSIYETLDQTFTQVSVNVLQIPGTFVSFQESGLSAMVYRHDLSKLLTDGSFTVTMVNFTNIEFLIPALDPQSTSYPVNNMMDSTHSIAPNTLFTNSFDMGIIITEVVSIALTTSQGVKLTNDVISSTRLGVGFTLTSTSGLTQADFECRQFDFNNLNWTTAGLLAQATWNGPNLKIWCALSSTTGLASVTVAAFAIPDSQAPVINGCPTTITVEEDEIANFNITATDDHDSNPQMQIVSAPIAGLLSGVAFPLGITNVVVSFTDVTGNLANCNFSVTVAESNACRRFPCADMYAACTDLPKPAPVTADGRTCACIRGYQLDGGECHADIASGVIRITFTVNRDVTIAEVLAALVADTGATSGTFDVLLISTDASTNRSTVVVDLKNDGTPPKKVFQAVKAALQVPSSQLRQMGTEQSSLRSSHEGSSSGGLSASAIMAIVIVVVAVAAISLLVYLCWHNGWHRMLFKQHVEQLRMVELEYLDTTPSPEGKQGEEHFTVELEGP